MSNDQLHTVPLNFHQKVLLCPVCWGEHNQHTAVYINDFVGEGHCDACASAYYTSSIVQLTAAQYEAFRNELARYIDTEYPGTDPARLSRQELARLRQGLKLYWQLPPA